jgi:hypothetical protein
MCSASSALPGRGAVAGGHAMRVTGRLRWFHPWSSVYSHVRLQVQGHAGVGPLRTGVGIKRSRRPASPACVGSLRAYNRINTATHGMPTQPHTH